MSLQAVFLSCIASYSRTHISATSLLPPQEGGRTSSYRFAKQIPISADWSRWKYFWHKVYPSQLQLPLPLGKWRASTHKIWQWVFDKNRDTLYRQSLHTIDYYTRVTYSSTRSGGTFSRAGSVDAIPHPCEPVYIQLVQAGSTVGVTMRSGGWKFPRHITPKQDFWESLSSKGGAWMWARILGDREELSWLATALTEGTIVFAADGSYNANKSSQLSGAGWIAQCTSSGKQLRGSAYERSTTACSYRGELLGVQHDDSGYNDKIGGRGTAI
jgi:hypothetical protein